MKGVRWKYTEASQRTVKAKEGQGCICAKEMKIGTRVFTRLSLLVILGFFPIAEKPSSYSRKYYCHIASPQKERNWLNSLGYKFKIFKRRSLYIGGQYFSLTVKMSYGEGEEDVLESSSSPTLQIQWWLAHILKTSFVVPQRLWQKLRLHASHLNFSAM